MHFGGHYGVGWQDDGVCSSYAHEIRHWASGLTEAPRGSIVMLTDQRESTAMTLDLLTVVVTFPFELRARLGNTP